MNYETRERHEMNTMPTYPCRGKLLLTSLALVALYALALAAIAAPTNLVTLAWDWPTNHVDGRRITNALDGRVYVGTGNVTRVYQTSYPIPTNGWPTNNTWSGPVPLGYSIYAVTAVGLWGEESEYSEEIKIQRVSPRAPTLTKYTITTSK